jgi:hypothetical protein
LLDLVDRCADDLAGLSTELASLREAVVRAFYGVVGVHVPNDPIGIELTSKEPEGYAHHAALLASYGHASRAAEYAVIAVVHLTGASIAPARDIDAFREYASAVRAARHEEESAQAHILRDIHGNPFRLQAGPSWLSRSVVALAQTIYTDRAFDRLPILADALEEAGCTDTEILAHCRGPGPHVRGCWVIDLILGKE